eukprot:TRINITY_DN26773_c0_g1_i1.p3 TRINITY_DN26773_c0_g1~~TRINITY_DN26773_c0_g1_i1.p3  ORF type:complete len:180 (+),score=28.25 TRINITY_DN26773_c0_g1_i1:259-798(+)
MSNLERIIQCLSVFGIKKNLGMEKAASGLEEEKRILEQTWEKVRAPSTLKQVALVLKAMTDFREKEAPRACLEDAALLWLARKQVDGISPATRSGYADRIIMAVGKSWFYQLGARGLKDYFTLRTTWGLFQLVVLAMGWSWSVWVAQTVAVAMNEEMERRARCQVRSMAYVDNFIISRK